MRIRNVKRSWAVASAVALLGLTGAGVALAADAGTAPPPPPPRLPVVQQPPAPCADDDRDDDRWDRDDVADRWDDCFDDDCFEHGRFLPGQVPGVPQASRPLPKGWPVDCDDDDDGPGDD
ncbi:hypothetical protein [Saccharopolyspora rosea]|uniref:Secreted protein n=1 Tax=Saccharopolyspora rosea TaxID=524884 RepID=A0ABW3FIE3_9PSEU|nr:hypothetical protein [Saccharopolyspora rosea]